MSFRLSEAHGEISSLRPRNLMRPLDYARGDKVDVEMTWGMSAARLALLTFSSINLTNLT